eukprot:scaffold27.g6012.t1
MRTNQSGFRVDADARDVANQQQRDAFMYADDIHPFGPTGHRYLAELLIGLTQTATGGLLAAPWGVAEEAALAEPLPPPMIPGNAEKHSTVCMLRKQFGPTVVNASGFSWVNERPQAVNVNQQKWGWVAKVGGATADILLDTRSSDKDSNTSAAGAQELKNQALIGYMASYEHMGQARVECVANCSCNATQFDALWSVRASVMQFHPVLVTQHEACRLRVTVLNETRDPGGGKKIKLSGLIVLPPEAWDFSSDVWGTGEGAALRVGGFLGAFN